MAYSASYAFAATSGTTLKWSLSAAGTLHATLRNQTTGFTEQGTSGLWEWVSSSIPDGYRGVVVIHSGSDISALSGLTSSNTHAILSVNPGEVERVEQGIDSSGRVDVGYVNGEAVTPVTPQSIDLGTDDRVLVSADTHTAGVTVPRVTLVDTTTDLTNGGEATVDEGAIAAAVIGGLAGSVITPRTYVQREHVELYRGDSYQNSEGSGRRIPFTKAATETHWPTTLNTVHLYVVPTQAAIDNENATALQRLDDIAGTITQATGASQAFYFELTAAQTDDLSDDAEPHDYEFQIVANKATHPATLREGTFSVRQTLRSLS